MVYNKVSVWGIPKGMQGFSGGLSPSPQGSMVDPVSYPHSKRRRCMRMTTLILALAAATSLSAQEGTKWVALQGGAVAHDNKASNPF